MSSGSGSSDQKEPYCSLDSPTSIPHLQRRLCTGAADMPICSTIFTLYFVLASCAVLLAQAASLISPQVNVPGVDQESTTPLPLALPPVLASTHQSSMAESSTSQPITLTTDAFFTLLNLPKKPSPFSTQTLYNGATENSAGRGMEPKTIWSNSVTVLISKDSWKAYTKFKQDTCRDSDEVDIAERPLNSTESGYFTWEERMFHQELRKIILPETKDGSYRSVIGSPLLRSLDPKILVSPQQSLCRPEPIDFELEAMNAQASHSFEDFLIDKVVVSQFSIRRYANGNRKSKAVTSSNNTSTVQTSVTLSPIVVEEPRADLELMQSIE